MLSEKTLKSLRIQAYAEGKTTEGSIQPSVEILRINMLIESEELTISGFRRAIENHEERIAGLRARADGYRQVLEERNK